MCDWCITQKKQCAPTESGSQKWVRVRGQKGPGVVKGKGKEKVVGSERLGQDKIGELQKKMEEMGEEMKEMKNY